MKSLFLSGRPVLRSFADERPVLRSFVDERPVLKLPCLVGRPALRSLCPSIRFKFLMSLCLSWTSHGGTPRPCCLPVEIREGRGGREFLSFIPCHLLGRQLKCTHC